MDNIVRINNITIYNTHTVKDTIENMVLLAKNFAHEVEFLSKYSLLEIFEYVKKIKYVPDPTEFEFIKKPILTIKNGGDCDDKAIVIAAYCYLRKIPFRFVIASEKENKIPTHIYTEINVDGWKVFDVTYPNNEFNKDAGVYTAKIIVYSYDISSETFIDGDIKGDLGKVKFRKVFNRVAKIAKPLAASYVSNMTGGLVPVSVISKVMDNPKSLSNIAKNPALISMVAKQVGIDPQMISALPIKEVSNIIKNVSDKKDAIKGLVENKINSVTDSLKTELISTQQKVQDKVLDINNATQTQLKNIQDNLHEKLNEISDVNIKQKLIEETSKLKENIIEQSYIAKEKLKEEVENYKKDLIKKADLTKTEILSKATEAADHIKKDAENFANKVKEQAQQLESLAIEKIKSVLENLFDLKKYIVQIEELAKNDENYYKLLIILKALPEKLIINAESYSVLQKLVIEFEKINKAFVTNSFTILAKLKNIENISNNLLMGDTSSFILLAKQIPAFNEYFNRFPDFEETINGITKGHIHSFLKLYPNYVEEINKINGGLNTIDGLFENNSIAFFNFFPSIIPYINNIPGGLKLISDIINGKILSIIDFIVSAKKELYLLGRGYAAANVANEVIFKIGFERAVIQHGNDFDALFSLSGVKEFIFKYFESLENFRRLAGKDLTVFFDIEATAKYVKLHTKKTSNDFRKILTGDKTKFLYVFPVIEDFFISKLSNETNVDLFLNGVFVKILDFIPNARNFIMNNNVLKKSINLIEEKQISEAIKRIKNKKEKNLPTVEIIKNFTFDFDLKNYVKEYSMREVIGI